MVQSEQISHSQNPIRVDINPFCYLCFVFRVCLCYTVLSVPCSFTVTCQERDGLLALLCVIYSCVFVTFPYGAPDQEWSLTVSIPDLCIFPYYALQ